MLRAHGNVTMPANPKWRALHKLKWGCFVHYLTEDSADLFVTARNVVGVY